MRKIIAFGVAALLIFGIAGCGAAEPQETAINETSAATRSPIETAAPTQSPMLSPTPIPEPSPAVSPSYVLTGIPENEVGAAIPHTFDDNGIEREYLLYLPEGISEGAPLVFVLHGYSAFVYGFMNTADMNATADKHGFAIVYPQGLYSDSEVFPNRHWNADFTFTTNDDVGFLTSLAAYLQQSYGFSSSETFACGLSNGGFMSYTLAVKAPGVFRAIASVAGTMSKGTWDDRDVTSDPTPILQIHGDADATVPIDGTMITEGGWGGAPEMEQILAYWADRDGLGTITEETTGNLTARIYSSSDSDYLIWYYLISGFPHDWPNVENSGLDTGELIWEFFSNYLD